MKNRRIHVQFLTVAIAVLMLAGCEPPCTDTGLPGAWQQDFDFEYGSGTSILQTQDGGYLIVGGGGSPHGPMSPELVKTDSAGQEIWSSFSSTPIFPESAAEMDDGSFVLVGFSKGQGNVVRLDADGTVIWTRLLGESGQPLPLPSRLVSTSDGNLAAVSQGHFSFENRIAVVKFDAEAATIWTSAMEVAANDFVRGLVPTEDGGVTLLTDTFMRRLDGDGATVWNFTLPPDLAGSEHLVATNDDGVVVLGDDRVARFDGEGNVIWNKIFASEIGKEPINIRATPDGGFVVGSSTYSYAENSFYFPRSSWYCQNMVLTRLNRAGNVESEREFSTDSISTLVDLAPTSDGGYIILGSRGRSFFSSYGYMFLMKVDGEE